MPLQAGHISSTMSDFIGFITRAAPATNYKAINYTFLKLRNQLRGVTLNSKVRLNLVADPQAERTVWNRPAWMQRRNLGR